MKQLRFLFYRIKNSIKYTLKRDVTIDELLKCNSLASGGYMSWRTYGKVVRKEVETRIRNSEKSK